VKNRDERRTDRGGARGKTGRSRRRAYSGEGYESGSVTEIEVAKETDERTKTRTLPMAHDGKTIAVGSWLSGSPGWARDCELRDF
jgi:hypothetical protein